MGESGDIIIMTSQGASSLGDKTVSVFLRVSDTGPGIKVTNQEDIFNPFYTTKATGTGLGLSIYIRSSNGRVAHFHLKTILTPGQRLQSSYR